MLFWLTYTVGQENYAKETFHTFGKNNATRKNKNRNLWYKHRWDTVIRDREYLNSRTLQKLLFEKIFLRVIFSAYSNLNYFSKAL